MKSNRDCRSPAAQTSLQLIYRKLISIAEHGAAWQATLRTRLNSHTIQGSN
ncbi:hypothetical protein [Dictyobacter vulcani]|uniref:hypothetical protein n=1 Tax=Dictyobacter vulcani TaxID=2607529 RepID=UPI001386EEA5|nr:hypothetical protein [Dictyobacter vulcani]